MIAFTVCAKKKIFKNLNSFIIEFLHLQSWIFSESITYLYIHRFIWLKLIITKISLTFRFHNDNVWFFFFQNRIYVVVLHLFDTEPFFFTYSGCFEERKHKTGLGLQSLLTFRCSKSEYKKPVFCNYLCVCLCGDYWGGLQGCRVPDVNLYIHVPYIR